MEEQCNCMVEWFNLYKYIWKKKYTDMWHYID